MPRRKKSDLDAALGPVFDQLREQVVKVVEKHVETQFAELRQLLGVDAPKPKKKPGRPRMKVAKKRGRPAKKTKAVKKAAPKKKAKRAKTADVMAAAKKSLTKQKKAVGIVEIEKDTGYSKGQIRRALGELIKAKAAGKSGVKRNTTYKLKAAKPKKPAKPKRKAAKPKKKAAKRKVTRMKVARKKTAK
ncbi:hypothetical protein ACFL51_01420 [Myxococcota bacterium]